MEYRKLGSSSLEVSAVGIGTWAVGNDFWGTVDDQTSVEAIQAAIDAGINLIDTAPAYGAGHAEEVVGAAIRGRRDKVVVATKCGVNRTKDAFLRNLQPESLYREIDDSLRRLGVEQIDLWQIHWPDPKTPLEQALEAILKIKEQGKFRYLGVSNFDVKLMEQARSITEVVSLQPQYSLLRRSIEEEIVPYCVKSNLGILGYGTLAGGILTGKFTEPPTFEAGDMRGNFYPYFKEPAFSEVRRLVAVLEGVAAEHERNAAQVAIAWTLGRRGITSALVGAKNARQARQNAAAGEVVLAPDEIERIDAAAAAISAT